MPGWDEASVDELLADPIVRDLMAADGVNPPELRAMLYGAQRTIECYAARQGGPSSLAGFAQLYGSTPSADPARPTTRANRGRSDVEKTGIAVADYSHLSMPALGSPLLDGELKSPARS